MALLVNDPSPAIHVCTTSPTYPNGAQLDTHPTASVWCFKGRGSWLNESDGEAIRSSAIAWRPHSPNFRNPAGL